MAGGVYSLSGVQQQSSSVAKTQPGKGISDSLKAHDKAEGPDFADAFADAIQSAGNDERVATDMAVKFADGDPSVGIHEVVIASEKANLSLRYTVTLKNKLLEAYRELMSTQV